MTLVALDVNATRIRALSGLSPRETRPVVLDGDEPELPLAFSLEGRSVQLGRAGVALCRRSPHVACVGFLPHLGQNREWAGPRQRLDAARAFSLALDHVSARCGRHQGVVVALPGYLNPQQRDLAWRLARKSRLQVLGTVDAALAATLAAHSEQPWHGLALVADVDDHALTWSAVTVSGDARLAQSESHPALSLRAWKERLLNAASDRFVRQSRRDPRDSAAAEQSLYDQLDGALRACREGKQADVAVESPQWYQNLILAPREIALACRPLLERALQAFHSLSAAAANHGDPHAIVLTESAARLPGLMWALENYVADAASDAEPEDTDDFGAGLLNDEIDPARVHVLGPPAVARAAHALAARLHRQTLEPGHLEAAPLLEAQPADAGLARLHFRGRDHYLRETAFTLGRDPRCDLAFDSAEYPSVSAFHCEVVYRQRRFALRDRSRHGTLINDRPVIDEPELRPGDWIRLGPGGPLLRFLGHALDTRKLTPTA